MRGARAALPGSVCLEAPSSDTIFTILMQRWGSNA